MPLVPIDDIDDARLAVYRDLPRRDLTRWSNRFIAESRLLVERLLASSLVTESILCSERHCDELGRLTSSALPVYVVPHRLLSNVVGFRFHRGMLACGRRPTNLDLSQLVSPAQDGEESTRIGDLAGPRLLVVCPQIVDPTNLGSVVRNCSAFGVDGLLLGPHGADVYSRRVVRVSMGTIFRVRVRLSEDLPADLESLAKVHGFHRVATVLSPSAIPLPHAERRRRMALLFGGEGHGLDAAWIDQSDQQVTLPMQLNTDSLNVATAAGVFLYHYTQVARAISARDEHR